MVSSFYLNASSLVDATAIFLNADMTMLAPDGIYMSGNIARELSNGVLLPQQTCPSCAYPCSDYPIDGGASQGVYKTSINLGASTGAVIVRVNPNSIPIGFSALYDNAIYNQFSSETYGYLAATSGATYLGKTADDCGIVAGSPYVLDISNYNGTDFTLSTNTEVFSVVSAQIETTVNQPNNCYMVIPKLNASPTTLVLSAYVPCGTGTFTVEVSCPTLLTGFQAVSYGSTYDCLSVPSFSFEYFVSHVNGSAGVLGLYDFVFEDAYGQNPLSNGYWYAATATPSGEKFIRVENGIVTEFLCP
jgi:hypothetical protein